MRAHRDHGLDGDAVTFLEAMAFPGRAVVGHGWRLVEEAPDPVAYEVADDAEPFGFDKRLNGVTDVSNAISRPSLGYPLVKASLGLVKKLLNLARNCTYRHRESAVGVVPAIDQSDIDADDVALDQGDVGRKPVYDLLVGRRADGRGKRNGAACFVALERRLAPTIGDRALCKLIELRCGHSRPDGLLEQGNDLCQAPPALPHQGEFPRVLHGRHDSEPRPLSAQLLATSLDAPALSGNRAVVVLRCELSLHLRDGVERNPHNDQKAGPTKVEWHIEG